MKMHKTFITLPEIKLVGLTARTNNAAQLDPKKAAILPLIQEYHRDGWADHTPDRQQPGRTYSVYTDYESDYKGDYTYLFGEEVSSFKDVPKKKLTTLKIPAQKYAKFTVGPGALPHVCMEAWKKIWYMTEADLGGARSYIADFEIYDQRAADPTQAIFDIYVGLKE